MLQGCKVGLLSILKTSGMFWESSGQGLGGASKVVREPKV
jgi:hypothetical protein